MPARNGGRAQWSSLRHRREVGRRGNKGFLNRRVRYDDGRVRRRPLERGPWGGSWARPASAGPRTPLPDGSHAPAYARGEREVTISLTIALIWGLRASRRAFSGRDAGIHRVAVGRPRDARRARPCASQRRRSVIGTAATRARRPRSAGPLRRAHPVCPRRPWAAAAAPRGFQS